MKKKTEKCNHLKFKPYTLEKSNIMELKAKSFAKNRLDLHRSQGTDSKLNIFEVAALMDAVCFGIDTTPMNKFLFSLN